MDDQTVSNSAELRKCIAVEAAHQALAKAQREMTVAKKDAENPFFHSRYATLAAVQAACFPALNANGFAVTQPASADGNRVTVTTQLRHEAGHIIEEPLTMTAKDDSPQAIGSTMSYARRYGLASMAGVATADDDAESATDHSERPVTKDDLVPKSPPPSDGQLYVTDVERYEGKAKKTGRPFTKYRVTFSNQTKASTFESEIADQAKHAMNEQMPVEVGVSPAEKEGWDPTLEAIRPAAQPEQLTADQIPF